MDTQVVTVRKKRLCTKYLLAIRNTHQCI